MSNGWSCSVVAGLVLFLGGASPARASIFDLYGFGARATAMGNALTADADDDTAAYFNPAGLTRRERVHLGIGLDGVRPDLWMRFEKGEPEPEPLVPEGNIGVHGGLLLPLGRLLGRWIPSSRRVALGVGFFHGVVHDTRIAAYDPERPQWYLYDSLPDKLILAAGMGVKVAPWLSVGGGLQVLAFVEGTVDAAVDLPGRRFTREELAMEVRGTSAPTFGILAGPFGGLRVGLSFRDDLSFRYRLPVRIWLEDFGRMDFDIQGTVLFTPEQWSLGFAFEPEPRTRNPWRLAAALTLALWSRAPDPSLQVVGRLGAEVYGRDDPVVEAASEPVSLGARDVLVPSVGVEYRLAGNLWARAGYSFRPSPLPTPTGRSNYVDGDAHSLGLGLAASLADPIHPARLPLTVEVAGQVVRLVDRSVVKEDPADPVGNFVVGGTVAHLSVTFRHDF